MGREIDISNTADIIDSRDIIARIKELEDEREALMEDISDAEESAQDGTEESLNVLRDLNKALKAWEDDCGEELKILQNVQEQAEGYSDWEYGEALIRDSCFTEYAEELARDIGAVMMTLISGLTITSTGKLLRMN